MKWTMPTPEELRGLNRESESMSIEEYRRYLLADALRNTALMCDEVRDFITTETDTTKRGELMAELRELGFTVKESEYQLFISW